jgi:hypothetical protein
MINNLSIVVANILLGLQSIHRIDLVPGCLSWTKRHCVVGSYRVFDSETRGHLHCQSRFFASELFRDRQITKKSDIVSF